MRLADQRCDQRLTDDKYRQLGTALSMVQQEVGNPAIVLRGDDFDRLAP